MTKIYYISIRNKRENHAGAKAPDDINELCRRAGCRSFVMPAEPVHDSFIRRRFQEIKCLLYWIKFILIVPYGSIVIYQHPMPYSMRVTVQMIPVIQRTKHIKLITLIHDLNSLRSRSRLAQDPKGIKKRRMTAIDAVIARSDVIISHNEHMRRYLVDHMGIDDCRIVDLGIFDYLLDWQPDARVRGVSPSVSVAGNLSYAKSGYIYGIVNPANGCNDELTIYLYGNGYSAERGSENMYYQGSFSPDDIPTKLTGDFGLVWDGESADTCKGDTGNYLRYNNPHKTSLYLAAGLPVIVWSQAAVADFIIANNVGIVVDSLTDLDEAIKNVSEEQYQTMLNNVSTIGRRIRGGEYFTAACNEAIRRCEK